MAQLIKLADWPGKPRGHVIFVHGLGGDPYDTWQSGIDDKSFWPLWLARDIEGLTVWTLSYSAPPTNWLGNALPLQDRAVTILEIVLGEPKLTEAPIAFVCHSLGGLVAKQVLREASDQKKDRPEARAFLQAVKAMVFIATPHTGSTKANWLDHLRFFAWPSTAAQDLVENDANLRNLNIWYRNNLGKQVANLIFYETQSTVVGRIVDAASADPGLPGVPILIETDHVAIAKPSEVRDLIYGRTRDFLENIFKQPKDARRRGSLDVAPRQPVAAKVPNQWAPRLIRIAALLLVGFIGFKGIQATFWPSDPLATWSDQQTEQQLRKRYPNARPEQINQFMQSLRGAHDAPTFDKAVEEAKKGNTRTAQGIWRQIYENEGKRAEEVRGTMAQAARYIAAAAVLEDASEGLAWYQKATAHDPRNLEGWLGHGDAAVSAGALDEAKDAFKKLISHAQSAGKDLAEAVGFDRLGNVLMTEGQLYDAGVAFQKSLDISKRLADADKSNTQYQRELAVSYDRLGGELLKDEKLDDARKAYQDSFAIRKKLADADTTNVQYQRDLAVSYDDRGDMLLKEKNLADATKAYRASFDIVKRLVDTDKTNALYQRDLSVSYDKLGDVLLKDGKFDDAYDKYQESFKIRQGLADVDKTNARRQRDLWVSYNKLGDVLLLTKEKKFADARASYDKGLKVATKLTNADQTNVQYRRDLSVSHEKLGDALALEDRHDDARKAYQDSFNIRKKLADANPKNDEYQLGLQMIAEKIEKLNAKLPILTPTTTPVGGLQ